MENVTPDANSAPATGAPAEPSTATTFEPPRDPEGYSEWRLKGTLPESKPKPKKEEEPATSKESAEGEGEEPEPEEKSAPAPEAGVIRQERKQSAADRLQELLGDLKRAGLTPHELKTFKREMQAPAKAPETTAQPPAPAAKKADGPPKLEDFESWEKFRAAELQYNDNLVNERVQRALQEQLMRQKADTALAEAKQRYGDEAETYIRSTAQAIFNDGAISPVIKQMMNESEVCADLLYVMGSNAKDFEEFVQLARSNPGQALRKVALLENLVTEELKKAKPQDAPERNESGQFVSAKPPAKKTEAPPPAREVSGKASAPPDEVASALARGDVRAYMNAMNRRDLAARQGR